MAYTPRDISKYLKRGESIILNGIQYVYIYADQYTLKVSPPGQSDYAYFNYGEVESIVEIDIRKSAESTLLSLLLGAGGVEIAKPAKTSVATDNRPLLLETSQGEYFFGEGKGVDHRSKTDFSGRSAYFLYLSPTESSRKAYDSLLALLPQLEIARYVNKRDNEKDKDANEFLLDEVEHLYDLQGVDLNDLVSAIDAVKSADQVHAKLKAEAEASPEAVAGSAVDRLTVQPFAVPYLITTQPDGYLPDMTDFTLKREGSVDDGWYSTVPIKGDRSLKAGETLSAFLVNRRDGEISRVDWSAPKGKLEPEKWPDAFARHIASQDVAMTAGIWDEKDAFSTEVDPGGAANPLRLWSHAKYRAFTNAPFAANLIQVLACNDDFSLAAGQTLGLQVRDLKTQALFEQHFFHMADKSKDSWSKPLCEQINRDSRLLRAGVLNNDCQVVPTDSGNAFWGPQCAELSVTLTLANWWKSREVDGTQALHEGAMLHVWVFDAFSHRRLAQHTWTPSAVQRGDGKWLSSWANALNTSEVSPYLRASIASPSDKNLDILQTDSVGLWHRGDGLRIFTSLSDTESESVGGTLKLPQGSEATDDLQVTVRHPFSGQVLHHAVFTPKANGVSAPDPKSWRAALIAFLKDQAWPELQFVNSTQDDADVRIPRFCELQIEIDPVDDDAVLAAVAAAIPKVTTVPGVGSFEVIAGAHVGELAFRLSRAAFDEGLRIAACVPLASGEDVAWPVSVTADKVIWGARTRSCTYKVTLDCPEKPLSEQQRKEKKQKENAQKDKAAKEKQIIGHLGVFSETQFWQASQTVEYIPPDDLAYYEPTSLLCEDYGNTERSEIFDTLGQGESGVDPRTGLFHAHYPVATLQGRNGLGPICDLTLHYSALRGNEAGLGDGWAWRFSSLDVRDRCLTLANGVRITFTSDEWKALGDGKLLKKKHCAVRSNKDYSEFILDLPSGRREVLSTPQTMPIDEIVKVEEKSIHLLFTLSMISADRRDELLKQRAAARNEQEHNAEFIDHIIKLLEAIKEKSKPKFPSTPSHWTQWTLIILSPAAYYIGAKLDYDEAVKAWEKHGKTKELDERIAYYKRPFVQLLPSRIVSLYGETLALEWKRQKGQFLLMGIKSGDEVLFTAEYPSVAPHEGDAQVNMQVWPQTDEGFEVKLELEECLLRTLTRAQENPKDKTKKQIVQQVTCGYADDPTLDRVLCRLTELDGSVECVQYRPGIRPKSGRPLWPQAVLHALIPGDGQENQLTTYRYTGRLLDTSDLLYIVEGERGAHGAREHHLLVFSQDERSQRQELLAGAASVDSQWLEFKARLPAEAETSEETKEKDKDGNPIFKINPRQLARSEVLRYTGFGDDLVQAIDQIKLVAKEDKVVVAWGDERVPYHREIVELLWRPGRGSRTRVIRSIKALLQVCPASQRPTQGQSYDRHVTLENDDGLPIELITLDDGFRRNAYYPAQGGDNIVSAKVLNGLEGVSGVPQLSCPKLPDYVVPPLMAEYQHDVFGHSLGLKLFGYRAVERDGRTFLELERQVVIEGVGVKGHFDGQLSSSTEWEKTADEVLWRERITSVSPADPKATPSGESKVREWSISDRQVAHLGKEAFWLETMRTCEDNPNNSFIVVRTVSKTQAGSEPISTEHCSRYSQRCLARIEESVETTWGYDAVGRVVDEAQYRLKPGKKNRGDDQKADRRTQTEYSENGKLATQRHDNGDETLAYLDGLQRTWRSEWRRAGSTVYLPLYECAMEGLDESQVLGSCEWDYLPGGQVVIKRDQVQVREERQPWMIERGGSTTADEFEPCDSKELSTIKPQLKSLPLSFGGATSPATTEEFFDDLRTLHSSKKKSDVEVAFLIKSLLVKICSWGPVYIPKLMRFLQGLAGRTGEECLPYNKRLSKTTGKSTFGVYLVDGLFVGALSESLSSLPAMDGVEPSDFSLILDDAADNLYIFNNLPESGSALFAPVRVTHDATTHLVAEQGLAQQCLSQHTTEYLTKTNGTFERTQTLSDGTGQQQLKLTQLLDTNGRVVSSERVVDNETRTYTFERDALGRVTKITRPDKTLIERTYHGFSNQLTELKVGGKVVATQTMVNDSTLKSRKVGSRTYTFNDDTVVLPDKTKLQTRVDAAGVQWDAGDSTVASLTRNEGVTSITSGSSATDTWKHSFIQPSLPGRRNETQTTPRGESKTVEWQSLRGNTVASLRADGHLQRAFADHEGRVLRTCQEHEDAAYRYDPLGQLQSRQVQALKAGEQWQVLSEHDGFGQEVTRTFLLNGAPRFEHRMTWRGDGRLASKASYEAGVLRSTERYSYDLLDRLDRYTCEAEKAEYCPKDAEGKAVKAQTFTWDALDNLVSCVTTGFDGLQVTKAFSYDAKDPTRMTKAQRGAQSENLTWSSNGYLEAAEAEGPKFAYNACGQLSKVSDASKELLASYEYDGYQRLAAQYVKQDETTRELRYDGDELIGEIWFDKNRAVTRRTSVSAGLAEYDGEEVRWLIDDPQVGIAGQIKGGEISLAPLLPFGEGAALDEVVVGYNGMRRDPVTGQYHAGNGYRSYDPTLCRYAQPDWLAPVGEGGINPYQHCPDPVNLHDPSGAIMLSRWEQQRDMQDLEQELKDTQAMEVGGKWRGLGLSLVLTVVGVAATVFSGGTAAVWLFAGLTALSVASFGLEVASVLTADSNPELSKALGIASMATGILSAACFMGSIKAAVSVLKQTFRGVWRVARHVGRSVFRLFKGQSSAASIARRALGALPRPTWGMRLRTSTRTAMRAVFREVDDFFGAPAPLQPMPTYERSGWLGKLMSAWDGPDPTKLTGRPARLYAWANQSRFVSKVNELGGLAIEANVLRGTAESSRALAQGDDSSSISVQARASLRTNDKPYRPRKVTPRYDLRRVLGLSG